MMLLLQAACTALFLLISLVNGQLLAPLDTFSQPFCGRFPFLQENSDLCCNGYHFPNIPLPMHKACCQSAFYDTRTFGCDGSKTFHLSGGASHHGGMFPFGVREQVLDRVVPTNYFCGNSMYDPNSQYCCGCCGDGDRKIVNKTDKYSLCCNGRWVVNPDRVLACCGINAYDTRFYMCTPPLEVVPRRPPLQPFVPTDFCQGRGYNPETDYCCGSSVLPKNSSQALCCNGNFFTVPDKTSYACCCDSFYSTATQTCDKDCTVRPIDKGGPKPLDYCGERIYNPLEDACCGNVFIANNSIGRYLCCDDVYYANVDQNLACCGKNVYDIYHYRCQDYHIIPLQPATVTLVNNINLPRYCGGTVPYDTADGADGLCCRGLYYPNSDGNGQCCGSAFFVPNVHNCRDGVVFFNGAPVPQPSLVYLPPTHNFQSQSKQYLRNILDSWRRGDDGGVIANAGGVVASAGGEQHDALPFHPVLPFQPQDSARSDAGGSQWGHVLVPRSQEHGARRSAAAESGGDEGLYLLPRASNNNNQPQQPNSRNAPTLFSNVAGSAWPLLRPVGQVNPDDVNANIFERPTIHNYQGPVVPTGPVSHLPNGQLAVLSNVEQISNARRTNVTINAPVLGMPGASVKIPPGFETQPAVYRYQYLQPRDAPTFDGEASNPPVEKARPLPASPYGYEYSLLCNGQPFDSKVHFCCGGQLIRIRPDPFQLCCGDIYYDNVNKDPSLVCCGRRVCKWNQQMDGIWGLSNPFAP